MFTIRGRRRRRYCDGRSRRDFLQVGLLGAAGLTLADALRGQAATPTPGPGRDTSVILFWLDGGISHLESYDPKPDAPAGYRSLFGVTDTRVPGIRICDQLPGHARVMNRLTILRSVHHRCGEHWSGPHAMLTGHCGPTFENPAQTHPSGASIVARFRGPNRPGMLPYVAVPFPFHSFQQMVPGYHSSAHLGARFNPFGVVEPRQTYMLTGEELHARGLNLPVGMTLPRLADRRSLWTALDRLRGAADTQRRLNVMDAQMGQAFDMTLSQAARRAFDLSAVDPRLRDRYGRNYLGQSALLARQLIEAGVRFVTVCHRDWDHHEKIEAGLKTMLPQLDAAVSRLIEDLDERGLLGQVIVLVMGDFGRTPLINKNAGRDHWSHAGSVLIGGGGLKVGQVIGGTAPRGEHPTQRPLGPADLWATIYHALGIDPRTHVPDAGGRPVAVTDGEVIRELG